MCGMAGIFDTKINAKSMNRFLQMNQVQFHRGPDEGGLHCEPGVGLSTSPSFYYRYFHRQQPLFNKDGDVCIIFNGEIYNFREIRVELVQLGYIFKTHSILEVIVHAWEAWGEACVNRLRGMSRAFAIWDRNRIISRARSPRY